MFWCPCDPLVGIPSRQNQQVFFQTCIGYVYVDRWILMLWLISVDHSKHPNSSVSGCEYILSWFGGIIGRLKWFLNSQEFTLHNRLCNKMETYIFHKSTGFESGIYRIITVPNLKCIYAVFKMLWSFRLMLVPGYSSRWGVAILISWVYTWPLKC